MLLRWYFQYEIAETRFPLLNPPQGTVSIVRSAFGQFDTVDIDDRFKIKKNMLHEPTRHWLIFPCKISPQPNKLLLREYMRTWKKCKAEDQRLEGKVSQYAANLVSELCSTLQNAAIFHCASMEVETEYV